MTNARAAHGTLVAHNIGGSYVDVAELGGDISPPDLNRPSTEVTPHNDKIDGYVMGVLRRGELTFPLNFLDDEITHDESTGLLKALSDKSLNGYRITFTDASSTVWLFSGYVQSVARTSPAREGPQSADVTIRPHGPMLVNGADFPSV